MKTKNKILIILASFILLLLLFNSKVFAAENQVLKNIPTDLPYRDRSISQLPDDVSSLLIFWGSDNWVRIYYSRTPNTFFSVENYSSNSFNLSLKQRNDEGSIINSKNDFYLLGVNSSGYDFKTNNPSYYCFVDKTFFSNYSAYTSDTVYILDSDTGEYESFFQGTPQGLEAVLEEGYQTAQTTTTLSITQQLEVLVPVGIAMMAMIIALSLVESLPLWKQ